MNYQKLIKHFLDGDSVIVENINRDTGFLFISWGDGCNGNTPLFEDNGGEYFFFNSEKIYLSDMFIL
jgi:hypothetical protein